MPRNSGVELAAGHPRREGISKGLSNWTAAPGTTSRACWSRATLLSCPPWHDLGMKALLRTFSFVHALMAILFACAALLLIAIAAKNGWEAIAGGFNKAAAQNVIESLGLLAAAVVALQISQTITEEEVIRDVHISAPTRIRRFLSRFLVVVVVAIVIEGLVATFRAANEDPAQLLYGASLLIAAAALLTGWGLFVRLNRYAEELEPEAMAEAKREDDKLE